MRIKLKELLVKQKNGITEMDFMDFFMNLISEAGNRELVKELIHTQENCDNIWLDHKLSQIFKDE
jgi:hypothetical protein